MPIQMLALIFSLLVTLTELNLSIRIATWKNMTTYKCNKDEEWLKSVLFVSKANMTVQNSIQRKW
jgi:hypothetical protein